MTQQEHIPVFFEGQDDLIDILATAICSVCYNTESLIDLYVLDCGICSFNKKLLNELQKRFANLSIEFIPIDLTRFKDMKGWPPPKYQFLDCYARLLIPELKPELDKAIYLDSDIIALGDIAQLWYQNMDGYALAAVADNGYADPFLSNCIKNLNVDPKHIYANAGMLLLDCKKWRKDNITDKLLQIGREYKEHLMILNEDILSVYFSPNNYKLLDNRFNLTDLPSKICASVAPQITDEYMETQWADPVIYHFCHGKPFRQIRNNYNERALRHFDSFWFFAQMTPFYAGMEKRFAEKSTQPPLLQKIKYKLFGFLPIMTIRSKDKSTRYKLFGFFPILKKKVRNK
jgi:lipopolysaccharide biosynthesis glycosyltransferase